MSLLIKLIGTPGFSRKINLLIICFAVLVGSNLFKAQPLHEYFLNSSFAENGGVGPTLTRLTACGATNGSFASGACAGANGYSFNASEGLNYANPSYITTSYTIHIWVSFSAVKNSPGATKWIRLLDLMGGGNDNGVYIYNNCANNDEIDFYNGGDNFRGTCSQLANTYYLYSFVRNGATNVVTCYIDGALVGGTSTYSDVGAVASCPTNTTPIIFFRDNIVGTGCEAQSGKVSYIGITSAQQTAAQCSTLYANLCSKILPIQLLNFSAVPSGRSVLLNWASATEENNSFYTIEKSTDAANFYEVGRVNTKAPGGNSNTTLNYTLTDYDPLIGTSYYRLKQTDKSGAIEYFGIQHVDFEPEDFVSIYPNPASDEVTLSTKNNSQKVTLRTLTGQELMSMDEIPKDGKISTAKYPVGTYILTVGYSNYKFVINR